MNFYEYSKTSHAFDIFRNLSINNLLNTSRAINPGFCEHSSMLSKRMDLNPAWVKLYQRSFFVDRRTLIAVH